MNRFLALLLLVALPAAAAPAQRYIVTMRAGASNRPAIHALAGSEQTGRRAARELDIINGFAAELTESEIVALKKSGDVLSIDPVVERHLLDAGGLKPAAPHTTGNPLALAQTVPYGIDLIHAREVWPHARGANVNVAIFDTGIATNHPDLAANIAGGFNTLTLGTNFFDDHGHGTHVAGTLAARDNGFGVVGVAPQARIWSIKVLGVDGTGTNEDVIVAADWVLARKKAIGGNWIISMSIGSGQKSAPEEAAFQRLRDNDVLSVAASGNGGSTALDYPAAYSSVLSVGAVDAETKITWFSNGGGTLGVVAPGLDVLSSVLVHSVPNAGVSSGPLSFSGFPLKEARRGDVHAAIINCGFGEPGSCNGDPTGKIAVLRRGNGIYFADKVRNAVEAGAIAAVIYNYDDIPTPQWSLVRPVCDADWNCTSNTDDLKYDWPVVVKLNKSDGEKILEYGGPLTISSYDDDYGVKSGTSMSTPHVAGVAALLWSLAPTARALDIRRAIELTAHDLGPKGFDGVNGNGLIDALAAAKALAPAAFGLPDAPLPDPGRRRSTGH
jgi:subtilisin family serine protease